MASSPLDVIKQYLVSLGFEVDKASYDNATKAIDSAGESLAKLAGTAVKGFGEATAVVSSFVVTAVVGMAKLLSDLGNAQIRYEMLARQMWTTQQNAEALDTTLKAMGTTLDQLYLSPTLMQQFQELHSQAFQMMPPAEFQRQMAFIQSITFEFKRLKLEGTYALQWIGYYFIKYMSGPIVNIKTTLSEINNIIIKTMPYWTKVVAEVMSWFAQFGVTAVEAIKDIAKVFNDVGHMIPNNIKLIGLAILALAALASTGPIGWITAAIIALGLAVNDFFTYIHGGQSEFGPFWQKLISLYNYLKDTGAIDAFKNGFQTAMKDISGFINGGIQGVKDFYQALQQNGTIDSLGKTFQNVFDVILSLSKDLTHWFNNMFQAINQSGVIKSIGNDVMGLLKAVGNVLEAFTGWLAWIFKLKGTNSIFKAIGGWITDFVLATLQTVDDLLKQITSGLNSVADLFKGDWGGAWNNFKDIFTKDVTPSKHQSYMYPSSSSHQTNNSSQTSMNVTQNIYGTSDPTATANAASSNISTVLRNQKGMIV